MTGRSLLSILTSDKSGRVDPARDHVLTGKERHAWVRKGGLGYPMPGHPDVRLPVYSQLQAGPLARGRSRRRRRALRPNRTYGDIDDSPTKTYMIEHRDEPDVKRLFDLAVAKRPAEELYDLRKDPDQLNNVADDPSYAKAKEELAARLIAELKATGDPRALGHGDVFDTYPYYGGQPPQNQKTKGKKRKQ